MQLKSLWHRLQPHDHQAATHQRVTDFTTIPEAIQGVPSLLNQEVSGKANILSQNFMINQEVEKIKNQELK